MRPRKLLSGSLFPVCFILISLIVAAGAAGKSNTLLTSRTEPTAPSTGTVVALPASYGAAPAGQESLERKVSTGNLPVLGRGMPTLPPVKVLGRRGAAGRMRHQYGKRWGSGAATAETAAVSQAGAVQSQWSGVATLGESEEQGPEALALADGLQGSRGNETAVLVSRGHRRPWWSTRAANEALDPWTDARFVERVYAEAARAVLEQQEAALATVGSRLRRGQESGPRRGQRIKVTLPLPVLVGTVVAAALIGASVTARISKVTTDVPAVRNEMRPSLFARWLGGRRGKSQEETTGESAVATTEATNMTAPESATVPVASVGTLLAVLVHTLPILILMWSPTAAGMFALYWFLTNVLPEWDTSQRQSSPAIGQQKQAVAKWLTEFLKTR